MAPKSESADSLPEPALRLLKRLAGGATHFESSRVEGHDVWRVRLRDTGTRSVVKLGTNISIARAMADSGVAPRVLASNDEAGICVMEDLGSTTLSDVLSAGDAEAASRGLLGLARTVGVLHGWSSTAELSLPRPPPVSPLSLSAFMNICGALDVDADRARNELIEAEHCVRSEAPQVIVHGDPCPDNFVPGASTQVTGKFVDFETTHRGNAMLEVACWHMPFPTCWRVARLPLELLREMDASYQEELVARSSQSLDTVTFQRLLAAACVYWLIWCLTGKRFVEAQDSRFAGPRFASVRERALLWLDSAARTTADMGHFELAGGVARELTARLRQRWAPMHDAPLYPAFLR